MQAELNPCMHDHRGRRVERWLPEMQSAEFLRAAIGRGERTDECWAVLTANHERVRTARAALAGAKAPARGPADAALDRGGER